MVTKYESRVSWHTFIALAVIFISLVFIHVRPNSSKSFSQGYTVRSNLVGQIPQIEAIGISYNGESYVSIEGKFVHEGDIVNGFKILNIYPDSIEFDKNGQKVVGVITSNQRLKKQKSNNISQQSLISTKIDHESSYNYFKQYQKHLYSNPYIAENGSYYGQISENTGRPKTVYVGGYYRRDGTYVRSHYRSPPRK